MRLGLWCRLPTPLGGGKSEAERIYADMRDGRGEFFSTDDSGEENRSLRAAARQIANAASAQRRGAFQAIADLSTDELATWERLLGLTPAGTDAERRALCAAAVMGNGPPDYDRIVAALERAIGESVTVIATTPPGGPFTVTASGSAPGPRVAFGTGSALRAGTHSIALVRHVGADRFVTPASSGAFPSPGASVFVDITTMDGADAIEVLFSVAPDSASLAVAARATSIGTVEIRGYPSSTSAPGLHHLAIIVSPAAMADTRKLARIHAVLGPMLSAWTTYAIAASSPFILDSSELGKGAL